MSLPNGPNPYLRTKIMTASPEELRLMLYDGCLRFCRQAREALQKSDFEASYENLTRAQKIVLELSTSLKHDVAPDLCDKLAALYTYIYRKLVDSSMNRDVASLDEAVKLVQYERETWQMLMKKVAADGGKPGSSGDAPKPPAGNPYASSPGAQQTAISSYSQSA